MNKATFAGCACLVGGSAMGAALYRWTQGPARAEAEVRQSAGVEPRRADSTQAAGLRPGEVASRGEDPDPEPRPSAAPPSLRAPSRVLPGPDPEEGKVSPPYLTAPSKTLPGPFTDGAQDATLDTAGNGPMPPP